MAHQTYSNFVLANEIEDQYNSYLDLARFCTVDNSLTGTPGMIKKINVYTATDGTEKLAMGIGNSKDIEVGYAQKEYEILMAQNRFKYFDEQEMTDPLIVTTGLRHMATDMFNHVNADIFAEFNKATLSVALSGSDYFGAFVDASAKLNVEHVEGLEKFAFVSNEDMAKIRKALKDDLKYVEAFARSGYVGTVADWNLYVKKDAVAGTIVGGTRDAVTLFNKKGTEVEQDRDGDIRQNTIWSRKYYLAALTDATKAVKITIGG
ncbi:MAG: hypothetical protein J6S05_05475 [Bacteroidaceae bacterium]|nr:hypothetical protein [Bacteroidaceae bacterium]